MPDHSKLLDFNPQLGLMNGLYQDSSNPFRESSVSNYLQIAIADIFANSVDKSTFSAEIEAQLDTDLLQQALAAQNSNYLLAMNLDGINLALDLTQDFGNVTYFLAQHAKQVDSIKKDVDAGRLTNQRCADMENILHISEDLTKLKFPQRHYDLIVIGELELLGLSADASANFIARLSKSLTETGSIFINARNPARISSWFDPYQDASDYELPYEGLYQRSSIEIATEDFSTLFQQAGLEEVEHYVSYSAPHGIRNLFSTSYLRKDANALNHFYRLGFIENPLINEYFLSEKLFNDAVQIINVATNNVYVCSKSHKNAHKLINYDFVHFPGQGRKPEWRSITACRSGEQQVSKTALHPKRIEAEQNSTANEELSVSQNLSPQPYQQGRILIAWWLQALLEKDFTKLADLIGDYEAWLDQRFEDPEFAQFAYDLLPFNILVTNEEYKRENYIEIDTEWRISSGITKDFVLFRALFWFAFENKALLGPLADKIDCPTLALFIKKFLPASDIQKFAELEEQIQRQIDNNFRANSVQRSLGQTFSRLNDIETKLECQLQWCDHSGTSNAAHAVVKNWASDTDAQKLQLELPGWDDQYPILRLDPLASRGIFRLSSVAIYGPDSVRVFSLDSFKEIVDCAELSNIQVNHEQESFLALNEDPFLNFDLSSVDGLATAIRCEIQLELLHGAVYDSHLAGLSDLVETQNSVIAGQASRLNEYRAELDFLKLRLADLKQNRKDLNAILRRDTNRQDFIEELKLDKRREVRHLNQKLAHLNEQLVKQINQNHILDHYLMQRPTTRFKGVVSRTIQRILGKPPVEPSEHEQAPVVAEEETTSQQQPVKQLVEQPSELEEALESETEQTATVAEKVSEPEISGLDPSKELIGQNLEDYQLWLRQNTLSEEELAQAKATIDSWDYKPVFSILVPIYNTDPDYLLPMIRSVQAQIYPHWQLCLVDDCSPKKYLRTLLEIEAEKDDRICLQFNEKNQGIALTSNDALAMATGDYIALLDHDDELSIDALYENAKVIQQHRSVGLIYSDEDKMDMEGNRLEPFFKPDYSPDLLDTNNYICHFTVIDKTVAQRIGGFREGLDGSQDHDIILRAIADSGNVVHIPKILYHWRKIPGSTAVEYDSKSYAWEAGRQAVEDCLQKNDPTAVVDFGSLKGTYRVFRQIRGNPLISIVIPFKDKPELLDACIGSILQRSYYKNFEIIGVSNNSEEEETFARMKHFQEADKRIRFVEKNIPFNFSAICNYGVEQAQGEYIVLLNNDVEVDHGDWLERLLEHAQRGEVGAVGGKLLYPDGRIQHAGVVVGMVGAAGHPHKFFPDNHIGYHGRLHMVYNVSAVTGAMLMVQKEKYLEVGGLDEDNLAVAYNDVDFCLKLMDKGYINVFTPHSRAIHHESISRGYEDTEEKLNRLKAEQSFFLKKWQDFLEAGDPYYNPNLSLENEYFSLKFTE